MVSEQLRNTENEHKKSMDEMYKLNEQERQKSHENYMNEAKNKDLQYRKNLKNQNNEFLKRFKDNAKLHSASLKHQYDRFAEATYRFEAVKKPRAFYAPKTLATSGYA